MCSDQLILDSLHPAAVEAKPVLIAPSQNITVSHVERQSAELITFPFLPFPLQYAWHHRDWRMNFRWWVTIIHSYLYSSNQCKSEPRDLIGVITAPISPINVQADFIIVCLATEPLSQHDDQLAWAAIFQLNQSHATLQCWYVEWSVTGDSKANQSCCQW